jgi:hypothetical protein
MARDELSPRRDTTDISGVRLFGVRGSREVLVPTSALGGGPGGGAPADAEYIVAAANATLSAERVATNTSRIEWDFATAAQAKADLSTNARRRVVGVIFDGQGDVLLAGAVGRIWIPYSHTIVGVILGADQVGDAVVDIRRDSMASYPPTAGDSICASTKPELTGDITYTDTTLTSWLTSGAAGDWYFFVLESASTIEYLTAALEVRI